MRVLALDPGDRVGWARADISEDGEWRDLRHGITPLRDMALAVHERTALNIPFENGCVAEYDTIVVEDWRLYPHLAKTMIGSSFPSVQFIGMVKLCCWLSGTKMVMQGASVKSTADKTMAKLRPDLYEMVTRPGAHDDLHDMDAIRHLFYWTFRNTDVAQSVKGAT